MNKSKNLIFKKNYYWISFCYNNGSRYLENKLWNYKTYLKQKLMKNLLDKNN